MCLKIQIYCSDFLKLFLLILCVMLDCLVHDICLLNYYAVLFVFIVSLGY